MVKNVSDFNGSFLWTGEENYHQIYREYITKVEEAIHQAAAPYYLSDREPILYTLGTIFIEDDKNPMN
jgi:hypothetical protein